jgi:hypothetical protein
VTSIDIAGAPLALADEAAVGAIGAGVVVVVEPEPLMVESDSGSSLPHATKARIARDARANRPVLITTFS